MSAKKRVGRPTKAATPGKRVSLGLKVTADTKEKIDKAARESGRTQSQEAELRIERAFEYDAAFTSAKKLISDTEASLVGDLQSHLRQTGYTPVATLNGKVWLEPGMDITKVAIWTEPDMLQKSLQQALEKLFEQIAARTMKGKQSNGD